MHQLFRNGLEDKNADRSGKLRDKTRSKRKKKPKCVFIHLNTY